MIITIIIIIIIIIMILVLVLIFFLRVSDCWLRVQVATRSKLDFGCPNGLSPLHSSRAQNRLNVIGAFFSCPLSWIIKLVYIKLSNPYVATRVSVVVKSAPHVDLHLLLLVIK